MDEHWANDPATRRLWFGWVREIDRRYAVRMSHEGIKQHALGGVLHLIDYPGSIAQAQAAVLEYAQRLLDEAGNPEQLTLI